MAKPKNGRPTALTPAVQERIVSLIRRGAYIETACGVADIDRRTMYEWLRKGQSGIEPYASFYAAATTARDEAEFNALDTVTSAARKGDVKAAQWYLEKTHGKKYSGVSVTEAKVEHVDRSAQAKAVREAYGFSSSPASEAKSEQDSDADGDGAAGSVPTELRH